MRRLLVFLMTFAVITGISIPVSAQDISASTFEQLTVADTAVNLAGATVLPSGKPVTRCIGILETANIRYRVDGTAATASIGHLVTAGSTVDIIGSQNISRFSAIRTGTTSAVLPFTCYPSPAESSTSMPVTVVTQPSSYTTGSFGDGTVALPGITFAGDTNTGWYRIGADNIGVALGGAIEQNWTATALSPGASDGNALGTGSLMWSDLFLASGGVINFNNGNATLTHASGKLTASVPIWNGTGGATTGGSIYFAEGTDNGTNTVQLLGPASTADVVVTLPAATGTVALTAAPIFSTSTTVGLIATDSILKLQSVADATPFTYTIAAPDLSANHALTLANGDTTLVAGTMAPSTSPIFTTDATAGLIATQDVIKLLPVTDNDRFTATVTVADLAADATYTLPLTGGYVGSTGSSDPRITAGSGTGVTVNEAVALRRAVYKVTVGYTQFDAAAVTHDLTIATLPAKTRLVGVYADVVTPFVCAAVCTTATLSLTAGTSAGGNEILLSFDIDAAAAVFGDADGELGAAINAAGRVQDAYIASWSATQVITIRGTSGTGNWGDGAGTTNLNAGSLVFYLITEALP